MVRNQTISISVKTLLSQSPIFSASFFLWSRFLNYAYVSISKNIFKKNIHQSQYVHVIIDINMNMNMPTVNEEYFFLISSFYTFDLLNILFLDFRSLSITSFSLFYFLFSKNRYFKNCKPLLTYTVKMGYIFCTLKVHFYLMKSWR